MKKVILSSFVSVILILGLAYYFGIFYVYVSPDNYYKLNEKESVIFNEFVSRFWEKVEKERLEEIKNEIYVDDRTDFRYNELIEAIKTNRKEFGKISSWKFFRSASPRITSTWANNSDEQIYHIEYLTKAEKGEFCAWFVFYVKSNKEIRLSWLSLDSPADWRIEERNQHEKIVGKYPNELIIPYGDRFIEIRY